MVGNTMSDEKEQQGGLSPEDAELWARITRTVEPLAGRARPIGPPHGKSLKPSAPSHAVARGGKRTAAGLATASSASAAPSGKVGQPKVHRVPPGGTLDRRTRQRLARGMVEIEARLDLHGFGVEEAHARLRAFIIRARGQGLRTVLVITGKGASPHVRHTLHGYEHWHAPERAGRLRRLLPEWLSEAGIAEHVAGFQPAHPKHGGGGAFYVRLRRRGR